MVLNITSEAFSDNSPIPQKYTGDSEDISPPLRWSGQPPNCKSVALIVDDPDAPTPKPWVHWVIFNLPPHVSGLPAHVPTVPKLTEPAGAMQGKNSFGKIGYGGPAPPPKHGTHHYHFHLFALDKSLNVEPGASADTLREAMIGHVLASGDLVGTYER